MLLDVLLEELLQSLIAIGTSETKGQIFELSTQVVQSQTIGKGGVEKVRFTSDFHLFFGEHRAECAHIVQAVCQLDKDGADVVAQGVEELAEVVFLLAHIGGCACDFAGLCHHFDQKCHVVAKSFTDVFDGIGGVFHHIVEESCHNGVDVKHKLLSHNARHCHGVHDIGVSSRTLLPFVCFFGKGVGLTQANHVVGRESQ